MFLFVSMEGTGEKILDFIKRIPKGRVCTYGQIARLFNSSPRAVGSIMHSNRDPVIVPCHRIVKSDGSIGGYSRGVEVKLRLLRGEGVEIVDNCIDLKKYGWEP